MTRSAYAWSALFALGLATACEGKLHGFARNDAPDAGAASAAGTAANTGSRENVAARCETSELGAPQLRRLTQMELQNTIVDVFPEIAGGFAGVRLGPDPVSPIGFSNDASLLVVGAQTAQEILDTAEDVATLVTSSSTLPSVLPCAASSQDAGCAAEFIAKYGPRLFRRPLTAAETTRYSELQASVAARSSFELGLKWALVAMLQSPHAVYRSEIGLPGSDVRTLTPYEVASALSYSFSGTTPSPELIARAEAGELSSAAALVAEARSLLATARGQELFTRLFREWAGYAKVSSATKVGAAEFTAVRESMMLETERFIDDVVRVRGGGVRELLTSSATLLDPALAAFYGFGSEGVATRPPEWSVGLLAQGSMLAGHAHSESSSPTLRGLFVMERLLCRTRPKVPPLVPPIEPPAPGAKTTRERYETSHAADPGCSFCHLQFDPIGFGFEHFDELGRYRADENGLTIDATGRITGPDGNVMLEFSGLTELASGLAELPDVTDCVSGLLSAYVFAGGGGASCLAEEARGKLARGEVGLADYLAELAGAPHFTKRKPR